jgi:protein-L-isoaspartate(D-aspartate) O-methyltransferase
MSAGAIDAGAHRDRYVAALEARGVITSPAVRAAFAAVPRERFVPPGDPEATAEEHLDAVYSDHALITAYDRDGNFTSTSSLPSLMARMLELLDLAPDTRVLEIGTGTGYNAALLASIVGPQHVTSVEVHDDVAERARANLRELGLGDVTVITGDAGTPPDPSVRWDRVVATTGVNDVPSWWWTNLADDPAALALVPLQHAGSHPLIALGPVGRGRYVFNTGFMLPRGTLAEGDWWGDNRALAIVVTAARAREAEQEVASLAGVDWADPDVRGAFWFHLTLADRRAFSHPDGIGLVDGEDYAISDARAGFHTNKALWGELVAHRDRWLRLGAPRVADHVAQFVSREAPRTVDGWTIRRAWHTEHVALAPA